MAIEKFRPEDVSGNNRNEDGEYVHPHDAVWENMTWDYRGDEYIGFVDEDEDPDEVERYETLDEMPPRVAYAIRNNISLVPLNIPVSAEGVSVSRDEHDQKVLGMLALIGQTRRSNGYVGLTETSAGLDELLSRGDTVPEVLSKAAGSRRKASRHDSNFYELFGGDELTRAGFSEEDVKSASQAMSSEMEDEFFGTEEKDKERRKESRRLKKRLS